MAPHDPEPPTATPKVRMGRFGTFGGVFTPSILTILGVVMYLRFGWVVGQAGLGGALLIVVGAHLISLATGLSVASIATNRTVGAGGAYYMISRSLGAPAGAAIGIPLFLGQALGVTFYVVGFTESMADLLPSLGQTVAFGVTYETVLGSFVCLALTAISIRSAALALKAQYVIMGVIVVSLVSFFAGSGQRTVHEVAWGHGGGAPFWEVFGVFFPAVTGLMAGVSMSGDLHDPRRSIPRGTLLAILAGFVVYMVFPVWLALHATPEELRHDMSIVWKLARVPALIYAGVWAATLSSALASVMTAPRTLQALALDGHAPRIFGRGHGKNGEPVAGLVLTFGIAQGGLLLGNLDAIAPILTMFFLVTYGFTNLACGLERWAASPSFRPDFKVPAAVSLFGALACFYVMSILNLVAMLAALLICGGIYAMTQRRMLGTTYGDARHGIWSALVRSALQQLRRLRWHPLNWRPNLLILGGDPDKRGHLLQLGSAIVQERGIVSYAQLLKGPIRELATRRRELIACVGERIAEAHPNVFYRVDIVDALYPGIVQIAQAYGVGSLEANTVLLGWPRKPARYADFVRMLQDLVALDRSILLMDEKRSEATRGHKAPQKEIHVWWGGLEGNGGLMLLLAFLLTADHNLRNARVRVMTVVNTPEEAEAARQALERIFESARLAASAHAILREGRAIPALMREMSGGADLAIVGFRIPELTGSDTAGAFFERMNALLAELPTTILVHGSRNFESEPVLFDS